MKDADESRFVSVLSGVAFGESRDRGEVDFNAGAILKLGRGREGREGAVFRGLRRRKDRGKGLVERFRGEIALRSDRDSRASFAFLMDKLLSFIDVDGVDVCVGVFLLVVDLENRGVDFGSSGASPRSRESVVDQTLHDIR